MKEIIEKADEYARSEIDKFGVPMTLHFEISNIKGEQLAKMYGVDVEIVQIGTRLMDVKLGEALHENKVQEHVKMGVEASREFLKGFNLEEEVVEKIVNCVEGHHKDVEWTCKEAEVAANADCYRFLLSQTWLAFLNSLGKRQTSFEQDLNFAESKADEKWNILSLDFCKEELEPHYKIIKEIVKLARKST